MKKIKNFQNIFEEQGNDKQNSELLVQRQTNKPMVQNKSPEIEPQKDRHLIYNKGGTAEKQRKKTVPGDNQIATRKKKKSPQNA